MSERYVRRRSVMKHFLRDVCEWMLCKEMFCDETFPAGCL